MFNLQVKFLPPVKSENVQRVLKVEKNEKGEKKKRTLHLSCPTQGNDGPIGKNPSNMMN